MWIFRLALWVFVLGFAAVLMAFGHWRTRSSPHYRNAVAGELAADRRLERSDISLCVFCTYRMKRYRGRDEYEFTLVIERDGTTEKVRVRGSAVAY